MRTIIILLLLSLCALHVSSCDDNTEKFLDGETKLSLFRITDQESYEDARSKIIDILPPDCRNIVQNSEECNCLSKELIEACNIYGCSAKQGNTDGYQGILDGYIVSWSGCVPLSCDELKCSDGIQDKIFTITDKFIVRTPLPPAFPIPSDYPIPSIPFSFDIKIEGEPLDYVCGAQINSPEDGVNFGEGKPNYSMIEIEEDFITGEQYDNLYQGLPHNINLSVSKHQPIICPAETLTKVNHAYFCAFENIFKNNNDFLIGWFGCVPDTCSSFTCTDNITERTIEIFDILDYDLHNFNAKIEGEESYFKCSASVNSDSEVLPQEVCNTLAQEVCVVDPEIEFHDCPAEGIYKYCLDTTDGELVTREPICTYFVAEFNDDGSTIFGNNKIVGSINQESCEIINCNTLQCNFSVCETPPCDPENIVTNISALLTVTFKDLFGFKNAIFEGPAIFDNEDGFYGGCG